MPTSQSSQAANSAGSLIDEYPILLQPSNESTVRFLPPEFSTRPYRFLASIISLGSPLSSRHARRVTFVTVGCCTKVFFSLA
jgi:hypothetical protein